MIDPPQRNRRWFQFSLRSLMIFTLIFAIPCAWLGTKIDRKRQERDAVETLTKLGANVKYDYQLSRKTPSGPDWLRKLLGENFFNEVEEVHLGNLDLSDDEFVRVSGMTDLKVLELDGTKVSDLGLENIKGLAQLRRLRLPYSITDVGLERLRRLTQLQSLSLRGTSVTDSGLQILTCLMQLQDLELSDTDIGDAGLGFLNGHSALRSLDLGRTKVSDSGLVNLNGLVQLQTLELEGTNVSDAGLAVLNGHVQLIVLNLSGTKVSDSGLANLNGLTQLQLLSLWQTSITGAGVNKLQAALPKCKIEYQQSRSPQQPSGNVSGS